MKPALLRHLILGCLLIPSLNAPLIGAVQDVAGGTLGPSLENDIVAGTGRYSTLPLSPPDAAAGT